MSEPDLFSTPPPPVSRGRACVVSIVGRGRACVVSIVGPDGVRLEHFTIDFPNDYRYASLTSAKLAQELRVRAAAWFPTEDL